MSLGVKLSLLTAVVLLSIEAGRMPLYGAARAAQPAGQPKLIVVFVADQMRADYVDDYGGQWQRGLRALPSGLRQHRRCRASRHLKRAPALRAARGARWARSVGGVAPFGPVMPTLRGHGPGGRVWH